MNSGFLDESFGTWELLMRFIETRWKGKKKKAKEQRQGIEEE